MLAARCRLLVTLPCVRQPSIATYGRRWSRCVSNHAPSSYAAVVVGAGPAGLAVVGSLLENQLAGRILWVDPAFKAGLLGAKWREVPSNTKVSLFSAFAEAVEPFRAIIRASPKPNAVTNLQDLAQDKGCSLSCAADMVDMLTAGLQGHAQVEMLQGTISATNWEDSSRTWTVESQRHDSHSSLVDTFSTERMVLCLGSYPNDFQIPLPGLQIRRIDLYHALKPSALKDAIPTTSDATVAVIGSSHSAILCLLNLFNLARTTHPKLRIKWFTRSPLQYAVPKDGWILRDNTGLKGVAADFARDNLEPDKLPHSAAGRFITRHDCGPDVARGVYRAQLPECQYIIHATGFSRNPLPKISRNGHPLLSCNFDSKTGALLDEKEDPMPRIYGAGIAFPERVTDPEGNVEHAVGMWKFIKYLKRVSGQWTA